MPELDGNSKVRYRERPGFVESVVVMPGGQRIGGELLAIGERKTIIVFSDGLSPSRIELPESQWGELEILSDS